VIFGVYPLVWYQRENDHFIMGLCKEVKGTEHDYVVMLIWGSRVEYARFRF